MHFHTYNFMQDFRMRVCFKSFLPNTLRKSQYTHCQEIPLTYVQVLKLSMRARTNCRQRCKVTFARPETACCSPAPVPPPPPPTKPLWLIRNLCLLLWHHLLCLLLRHQPCRHLSFSAACRMWAAKKSTRRMIWTSKSKKWIRRYGKSGNQEK